MDYNKIGAFIESERKAKKLTQAKLAEKLFVSEKTISKWETGKGIPDTNSLPKLCEIFGISINELLNGEKISKEDYEKKAEESILNFQKQKELSDKRMFKIGFCLTITTVLLFVISWGLCAYLIEEFNIVTLPVILMVVSIVALLVSASLFLKIEHNIGRYVCPKCGHTHTSSYFKVLFSPHLHTTRYLKCPSCKNYGWNKKIFK